MPAKKKKSDEHRTLLPDQGLNMIWAKWLVLPMAIMTILVAGSVLNLIGYFLMLRKQLGLSNTQQEAVRWSVAAGYYGGILAGPLIHTIGYRFSLLSSAGLSLVGFIILSFYTESKNIDISSTLIIISLLILVGLCSAISTIASVSAVIKNFHNNFLPALISILISYYMVSPYFEKSIRTAFMIEQPFQIQLIAWGIFQFLTYVIAAFIIKKIDLSERMERASSQVDGLGIAIFIAIEALFLALIYFACILAEKWTVGVVLIFLLIAVNFAACFWCAYVLKQRTIKLESKESTREPKNDEISFTQSASSHHFYVLLVCTFLVVGSCTAFQLEAPTVGYAMGNPQLGLNVMKTFWMSDILARFAGGLWAAYLARKTNRYFLAAATSFWGMFGFTLALFSQAIGSSFFYISSVFVGAAVGGFWILVPIIIVQYLSTKYFEILWGIVISVNLLGVFTFDKIFMWIADKEAPTDIGTWEGYAWYLVPYIISAVLWGLAGGICSFQLFIGFK